VLELPGFSPDHVDLRGRQDVTSSPEVLIYPGDRAARTGRIL
jgi:hypothetical protein